VTDPSSRSLTFSWVNLGSAGQPAWRISQVSGPQYSVTYAYGGDFNLSSVTLDPGAAPHLSRTTSFTYTTATGPLGAETGLLASITDPLSHVIRYTYTVNAGYDILYVATVTEPVSGGTTNTWTFSTVAIPGQNSVIVVSCTGLNLRIAVDSQLRKTAYVKNVDSNWVMNTYYDAANNVTQETQVDGFYYKTINYTYGPHGNVLTQSFAGFTGQTATSYFNSDKYFQKQSVTDPNGHTTSFDYFSNTDANPGNRGNVKLVQDARYGITGKQFTYTYNSYGQKASETNLNGVTTQYSYGTNGDTWGNLTQVIQDTGTGHLNRTTTMVYDVAGHPTSSTDPAGWTSTFVYNVLGQPTSATFPAANGQPSESLSYIYDANGRSHSVTDNRGTTTLAYESNSDRLSSSTDPVTGAISYTYNVFGQKLTMGLPGGGTWQYSYNTDNNNYQYFPQDKPDNVGLMPTRVTDDQGRPVDYTLGTMGNNPLVEIHTDQALDGNGNPTAYLRTLYTYDGTSTTTHGWLAQLTNRNLSIRMRQRIIRSRGFLW
jgi:YD repeat-containing protein